jgi:hypothetical protein
MLPRLGLLPFLLLLAGANPPDRVFPYPGGGPALIVPARSPAQFTGFDEDGGARFSGRFVLSGTFVYHCEIECEPGMKEADLSFGIMPDRELAKRLPHWQDRGDGMIVDVSPIEKLRGKIAPRNRIDELLAGKIPDIRGRISVVVEDYSAGYGCDYSPYYSARFVSVVKPPQLAQNEAEPNFGCA